MEKQANGKINERCYSCTNDYGCIFTKTYVTTIYNVKAEVDLCRETLQHSYYLTLPVNLQTFSSLILRRISVEHILNMLNQC